MGNAKHTVKPSCFHDTIVDANTLLSHVKAYNHHLRMMVLATMVSKLFVPPVMLKHIKARFIILNILLNITLSNVYIYTEYSHYLCVPQLIMGNERNMDKWLK